MTKILEWPLAPWETLNMDVLALAEPRNDSIAYTRGYLAVAGVLSTARKTVTEWEIPGTLLPDRMPAHLPVSLGQVSWQPAFMAIAEGNRPASIVTIWPKDKLVQAQTMPNTTGPKYDYVSAVRTTADGDIWHVARAGGDPAISRITIGRIRPGSDKLEYWPLPLGWGGSMGLAVEDGGRAIWTTGILAYGDFRHAVIRLDPAAGEVTWWTLRVPDPVVNQDAIDNIRLRGPVVLGVTPTATVAWWLLTAPGAGTGGHLVRLDAATGGALQFETPPPQGLAEPLALTLDAKRRPWVTFETGNAVATITGLSCGTPFPLKKGSAKVKPREAKVKLRQATVAPTTRPVVPVSRTVPDRQTGCFQLIELGLRGFDVAGAGVPLAGSKAGLFVSNGVDRIVQVEP